MKLKLTATALFTALSLSGCKTLSQKDVVQLDAYSVCKGFSETQPISTARRSLGAVISMGLSEARVARDKAENALYEAEMVSRGIKSCSSEGLAKYECEKIYSDTSSSDFLKCSLEMTYTIDARKSADEAKEEARRAKAAAFKAQQELKKQKQDNEYNAIFD